MAGPGKVGVVSRPVADTAHLHAQSAPSTMNDGFWEQAGVAFVSTAIITIPLLIAKRSQSGMLKVNVATVALSVAGYLNVVWATVFNATGAAESIEAFGQHPFGMPWFVFMPLMFAVVGAPVPLFMRYLVIEVFLQHGVLNPAELPAGWKRGYAMAKWVLGYILLLVSLWIGYTAWRGI